MNTRLFFEISPYWLILIFLFAGILSWWMYRKKGFSGSRKWLLGSLRFLVISFLGLLLLSPFLEKTVLEEEKPLLLWLEDRSSSMTAQTDSLAVGSLAQEEIPAVLEELQSKFRVLRYGFHGELFNPDTTAFPGEQTNLYAAIQEAQNRHYNENIGAMVLWSDGIYNLGLNPLYLSENSPFPIYTLGHGDTTVVRDIFIRDISHNSISFLNNEFQLIVGVQARELPGRTFQLQIADERGKIVHSTEQRVEGGDFYRSYEIYLRAEEVGLKQYRVFVSALPEEVNTRNNSRTFGIEILDNRKKVLLWGRAPHPDISAIGRAAASLEKYELRYEIGENITPDPETDLIIMHSPDAKMIKTLEQSTLPYVVINGSSAANTYRALSGIDMRSDLNREEIFAATNPSFSLFGIEENLSASVENYPPLDLPFGRIGDAGVSEILFFKQVGKLRTQEPLWLFKDIDGRRSAHILGSGIWRWRLHNYRNSGDFKVFDDLIAGMLQYLTVRAEDSRFKVEHQSRYSRNEDVNFNARLYNKSLELTNEAEVNLSLQGSGGEQYNFVMNRVGQLYRLNAGKLPPDSYTFKAITRLGDEEFQRSGTFLVERPQVENSDLLARHDLLQQMSRNSGGQFFPENELPALQKMLLSKIDIPQQQIQKKRVRPLLDEKWLSFLLFLCMAGEWALRKYFGKY